MTVNELNKFIEDHEDFTIEDILIEMEMAVDGDGAFENGSMSAKEVAMYTELIRHKLKGICNSMIRIRK